jgi:type I restriction enzyme M protein
MRDKVLMIDARNVYRKVTRKIYDFSPEQLKNITSIVWLSRGQSKRFLELISEYIQTCLDEADKTAQPLAEYQRAFQALLDLVNPFMKSQSKEGSHAETYNELKDARAGFIKDSAEYRRTIDSAKKQWVKLDRDNTALHKATESLLPVAGQSRDLVKQADQIYKLATRLIDICEKELKARENGEWQGKETNKALKSLDEIRKLTVEQLRQTRYFYKQAHWLQERFPDAKLKDVEGLVKLVSIDEIEKNDWSLTPGRYVGVAPEEIDEDFDFEEALRNIHVELQDLNIEAVELAARIAKNFEELGI